MKGIKLGKCYACDDKFRNMSKHKGLIRGLCSHCYLVAYHRNWKSNLSTEETRNFNNQNAQRLRASYSVLKAQVVKAYGGKCECCGEVEPKFLCVDHVNGGGCRDRRENDNRGRKLYSYLRNEMYPKDGYRLLCFNCNIAVHRLGYCPHKKM